jgi:DNA-directed RNA polymerase subunit N (RpoN/RPB10)
LSLGIECFYCGKPETPNFVTKELFKEKIDRIEQIKRMISQLMVLTANSKRIVANFASSRLQ